MEINGFKFRYINSQCYEFILPNGKHIVTDPYISVENLHGFRKFSVDEIEQCDYILLTHTHFDHTTDIGYLSKKFNPKLFVGDNACVELAKYSKAELGMFYPISNMQTYELADFKLTAVRGKHFPMKGDYEMGLHIAEDLVPNHGELNVIGSIDTYDFCITLNNNVRIMFVSGFDDLDNINTIAREFRPNVVIRHTAGCWTGYHCAELISKFNAQLALPNHHDNLYNGKWGKTMDDFTKEIQDGLRALNCDTQFLNPEPYQWYTVSLGIS
jgi:phosphoribosyl 1,2-cyclic phosphodiesterase